MSTTTKEFNAKHGVLAGTSNTNHLKFSGSATGNPVTVCAQGSDTDISIYLLPKGNGTVNFPANVTAAVSLTNDNSTNATFYPTFSTTSSGIVVGLTASSSKFSFNPSSGMLCSALFNGICVGFGSGNVGTNVAVGYQSLNNNTTGNNNSSVGAGALQNNATGTSNTAIGTNSLYSNSYGSKSVAVGTCALYNANATGQNIAIGHCAGAAITTGVNNVIIGGTTASSYATSTNTIVIADGSGNERIIVNSTGQVTVPGNLVVNGTTVTVNSTTITVDDPVFTLGGDTAPTSDDNKDRGIEFRYHTGSSAKVGFFGFDDSSGRFTFIPDATNTSEVFSGTKGYINAYIEWADIQNAPASFSITVADDTTTNADYYPTFATTTGTLSGLKVATTELTFNPGTNLFTVPSLKVSSNLYDSTSSAGSTGYVLSISGTGTVVWAPPAASNWIVKTSNYTANSRDQIVANTSGGSFTITLPATPSAGDTVKIADGADWSVNNLIVARNGSTIEGTTNDLTVDIGQIIVDFIYNGTSWQVYASVGAEGPPGSTNLLTATDDTTSTTLYPVMVSTDGSEVTPKVTKNKLSFNASTGELTAIDFNSASDRTLKENINSLTDSMSLLKQINPVSFKWKGSGKQSYGVIAQELEKILPELIEEENNIKSVKYIPLIALLINAIVELEKKIGDK